MKPLDGRRLGDIVVGKVVTAVLGGDGFNGVSVFEEVDVVMAPTVYSAKALVRRKNAPFNTWWMPTSNLVGDVCSERTFKLLVTAGHADAMYQFLTRAVGRLGGSVVDVDRAKAFATKLARASSEDAGGNASFQHFVASLHDAARRSDAGIRMPGDAGAGVK